MTKYIDKTGRIIKLEMKSWNGNGYEPSFEADFFDDRRGYDEETDAYIVDDIDYIIDQAMEWKYSSPCPDDSEVYYEDVNPQNDS